MELLDRQEQIWYTILITSSSELFSPEVYMKSNKKAIIKDTAYNSFLIFVLVTIVGMFSNVIILAFGYMISLPISKFIVKC